MSKDKKQKRLYKYRYGITVEIGDKHYPVPGCSPDDKNGNPVGMPMTKEECRKNAEKDGMVAVFDYGLS